jgi:sulfate adenylyltransferase subunit 2
MSLLDELEAESIYILREAYAQFQRPTILYSVGKDSSVVVHLARKAFFPKPLPFPLLHVDTGFDFPEMYEFRDWFVGKIGAKLLVYRNEEAISKNANPFDLGTFNCCDLLRTKALVQALKHFEVDAAIGGARREEEKSRAKERVFSFRDSFGQWEPKNQRPELWNLYNGRIKKGEGVRVFPLSNWTELDIWNYIDREDIPIVPLYFAAEREVIVRGDLLIPTVETRAGNGLHPGERVEKMMIRYRTLGCSPCTGAVRSEATTVKQIVQEMMVTNISERSTRIIDHDQEGSMEKKKREGYF